MLKYLRAPSGMALPEAHILNLFEDDREAAAQMSAIDIFLGQRGRTLARDGQAIADVIIYYVGHGGNDWTAHGAYFLAIRRTNSNFLHASSIGLIGLRQVLTRHCSGTRKYLILDCCFAAFAVRDFILQSPPAQAMIAQVEDEFPAWGTALLCASGSATPARTFSDCAHTPFSGALLEVLWRGIPGKDRVLSLHEVGKAVSSLLKQRYLDQASRPELHNPDQPEGEISHVRLFPNPAASIVASDRKPAEKAWPPRQAPAVPGEAAPSGRDQREPVGVEVKREISAEISELEEILLKAEQQNEVIATSRQLSDVRRRVIRRLQGIGLADEAACFARIAADPQIAKRKDSMQAQIRSEAGRCIRYLTALVTNV
jgi:hypothetical protein